MDHEDHEHQVEEYSKGVMNLKIKLAKMNNRLKLTANRIQKHQKKIWIEKKVRDLQIKKDALLKQIEEIDNELLDA